MPRIKLLCAPPKAHCLICWLGHFKRNRIVIAQHYSKATGAWNDIALHVPCMGVFLVFNTDKALRIKR